MPTLTLVKGFFDADKLFTYIRGSEDTTNVWDVMNYIGYFSYVMSFVLFEEDNYFLSLLCSFKLISPSARLVILYS